jgi:hypothetical protein
MDGVLSNFNSRWERMFGKTPRQAREQKETKFSTYWNTFIESRQFSTLDMMDDAQVLIDYLNTLAERKNFRVAILSSTGGFDRHNHVMISKRIWLENHKINWPMVFVPGRRFKAGYADKYSLMIDDTEDVITSFKDRGGDAVLHTNAADTVEYIRWWIG